MLFCSNNVPEYPSFRHTGWPKLVRFRATLPVVLVGPNSPKTDSGPAACGPRSAEVPSSPGRMWRSAVEIAPHLVKFGPASADFDRLRPQIGRTGLKLRDVGRICPHSGVGHHSEDVDAPRSETRIDQRNVPGSRP